MRKSREESLYIVGGNVSTHTMENSIKKSKRKIGDYSKFTESLHSPSKTGKPQDTKEACPLASPEGGP